MFNIKLNHGLILVSLAAFTVSCTNSRTKDADKRATPGQENTAKVPGDQTGSQQIQTNVNEPSFTDNRHGEQTNGALGAEPKINSDRKTVSIDSNGVDNKINNGRGVVDPAEPPKNNGVAAYKEFAGTADDAQIQKWVEADKVKRGEDAKNFRYAFIPASFLTTKESANRARIGLSKALNSVAVNASEIHNPIDVSDGAGIVFAIPISKYWGTDGQRKWDYTAAAQGRRPFSPAPRLDLASFPANAPVAADRLAYNVLHGSVYNELIETPSGNGAGRALKRQLQLPEEPNIKMGVQNAITYGPRFVRRFEIPGYPGGYWESLDDFNGRKQNMIWLNGELPRNRGDGMISDFGTTASETWYHMKNGMPAYFIFGNVNQERSKAEKSFVVDPLNNRTRDLVTGFCVFCHISGIQSAPNDMWTAIEEGNVTNNVERARQYWTNNDDLSKQYAADRAIIDASITKIVTGMSDGGSEFNTAIITGADGKEACYFLTKEIRNGKLDGQTDGFRRRNANGTIGPGSN